MASRKDFEDVQAAFASRLSRDGLSVYEFTIEAALQITMRTIQDERGSDETSKCFGRLQYCIKAMDQYANIIEGFVNTSSLLCSVWGPMKFCLQVLPSVQHFILDLFIERGTEKEA